MGQPRALIEITNAQQKVQEALSEWSHALYLVEKGKVNRLLDRGDVKPALAAAAQLLRHCLATKEGAFGEAAYDTAMAYLALGTVTNAAGRSKDALQYLAEAQRRRAEVMKVLEAAPFAGSMRLAIFDAFARQPVTGSTTSEREGL